MTILNGGPGNAIDAFHTFVSPFLLARDISNNHGHNKYSKWDEVIECFLAIYCLNADGTFKRACDVTQIFAQFKYLCRGTALYEGLKRVEEFDNNPYR